MITHGAFLGRGSLITFILGIVVAFPVHAAVPGSQVEPIDPNEPEANRRAEAEVKFYGPEPDAAYLDYKNQVAAQQLQQWAPLMPANGTSQAILGPLSQDAANTWIFIGPSNNDVTPDTTKGVNAGRISTIVTDPIDPKILYVSGSGGGVFKTTNGDVNSSADWIWTPITDNLPASGGTGTVAIGDMAMSPADHNTLFLGLGDGDTQRGASPDGAGRGLYTTHDGGQTWNNGAVLGNASRTNRIVVSSNGKRVFVATNDGLWRSTDGGATFSILTNGVPRGYMVSLAAFDDQHLVVVRRDPRSTPVTGLSALFYTTDGGDTWTQSNIGGDALKRYILVHPSGVSYQAIFRATVATSPASKTIGYAVFETSPAIEGGTNPVAKGLLKTIDAGANWVFIKDTSQTLTGDQAWYNLPLWVDSDDINTIRTGLNLKSFRTSDGGQTWKIMADWLGSNAAYAHADKHYYAQSKTGQKLIYEGNDGGLAIYKAPDRANPPTGQDSTFLDHSRNRGIGTFEPYHLGSTIATSPADSRYRVIIGLQDNGTRVRKGSGPGLGTSLTFDQTIGGDGIGCAIHQLNGNLMLGTIYDTQIFKSTDGGNTFDSAVKGIVTSESTPFFTQIVLGLADPTGNTVYTFTEERPYVSTDFADHWAPLSGNFKNLLNGDVIRNLAAAPSDPGAVAVVTGGGTGFITYDSGKSWTPFGNNPDSSLRSNYLGNVAFDQLNSRILYVTSVAQGTTFAGTEATRHHIWRSVDGAQTFQPLDGTPSASNGLPFGVPVHFAMTDPRTSSVIYAGTDYGLYRSVNFGGTWHRYGANLPMVAVRDLYIAADLSYMRIATYGRGVWELDPAPINVSDVSPHHVDLLAGASQQFTVTLTGDSNDSVVWSVQPPGGGSISPDGVYSAPFVNGSFTVVATSAIDPSKSASATVTVSAPVFAVSPVDPTVLPGFSFQFSSGGYPVVWSASAGTITSQGLYTAPSTPGDTTVMARVSADPSRTVVITVKVAYPRYGSPLVDGASMAFFSSYYAQQDPRADLNIDGQFNDADVNLFLNSFGK